MMRDAMAIVAPKSRSSICLALNLRAFNERLNWAEPILEAVEKLLEIPVFQFQQATMSKEEFIEILERISVHAQKHNRMCLLLAGGSLDEYVTTSCLTALAKGLDVFLLNDTVVCSQPKFEHVFLQRLTQAGAVSTTLGQCLFQWALEPENEYKNTMILNLAKELAAVIR